MIIIRWEKASSRVPWASPPRMYGIGYVPKFATNSGEQVALADPYFHYVPAEVDWPASLAPARVHRPASRRLPGQVGCQALPPAPRRVPAPD